MGGRSSSSSASSTSSTVNNYDKRLAIESGVGISGDGSLLYNYNDSSLKLSTAYTDSSSRIDDHSQAYSFTDSSSRVDSSSQNYDYDNSRHYSDSSSKTDNSITNVNSTDAVKFIAQAGSDFALGAQKSVIDLTDTGTRANLEGWQSTIDAGTSLLDRLTDKTFALMEQGLTQTNSGAANGLALATQALDAYKPTESKQLNTVAIVAAAGVAAVLLLGKK